MNHRSWLLLALLYTIAYVYSVHIGPELVGTTGWAKNLNCMNETCLVGCDTSAPISWLCNISWRGENYYINATDDAKESIKSCLITFWGFAHWFLYACIGFLYPELFWETFTVGVGFEIYEYLRYDCHDSLDLIFNSFGFLCGRAAQAFVYG